MHNSFIRELRAVIYASLRASRIFLLSTKALLQSASGREFQDKEEL